MRILEALKLHLKATVAISAIVGESVYKRRSPQSEETVTRIVLSLSSVDYSARSNKNRSNFTKQLVEAQVSIDCYSLDEDEVETLAQAVATTLDDQHDLTIQGVKVRLIRQINEHDNWEPRDDASDEVVYRISQDYEVDYLEPTT